MPPPSPGRAKHKVMRVPTGTAVRRVKYTQLEVLGNGQGTLPPSWHITGVRYKWVGCDLLTEGFPDAPAWVLGVVLPKVRPRPPQVASPRAARTGIATR